MFCARGRGIYIHIYITSHFSFFFCNHLARQSYRSKASSSKPATLAAPENLAPQSGVPPLTTRSVRPCATTPAASSAWQIRAQTQTQASSSSRMRRIRISMDAIRSLEGLLPGWTFLISWRTSRSIGRIGRRCR